MDKQTDVIRHHHIAPNGNVEFISSAIGVMEKSLMCDLDLSNLLAAQRAKRHKENGRIVGLKDLIKPGRTPFDHARSVEAVVSAAQL